MRNIKFCKHTLCIFLFFIICNFAFGQKTSIDYYGINSDQLDSNIAKMTSDLYYTQLSELNNFSVNDKRTSDSVISRSNFSKDAISFYASVSQDEVSGKWLITYNVIDGNDNSEYSDTKKFDSYYKILMEPKTELQTSLKKLFEKFSAGTSVSKNNSSTPVTKGTSTDELSGTWEGEDSIDKIVIMRGGRGFIIFNNGASMNISVNIINSSSGAKVKIEQKSRSNASFFPELSRQVAMKEAINADPITWELSLTDENTLHGIKNTLFESNANVKKGSVDVTWKRKL
ncbi:MAG: hypothetical protein K6A43_06435 [Treponema sp.]|nr:hypothetical protein [Treponema sp.]